MGNVFAAAPQTIFDIMSQLAREHDAVNLGQGFPDDQGPLIVRQKAADEVLDGWNQYPPMMGLAPLRQAIAEHYMARQGLSIDWPQETMVTSGATEALAASILALVEPGDEVVLFQPFYDAYLPLVLRAGGIPRFVNLDPKDWSFDEEDLRAAFSSRTRAIIFNDPLNPAATCSTPQQRRIIANLCNEFDAIAICDEVWEEVIFDGIVHESLFSLPDMRERTVKIGSAGKMFSLTGWKVGFVVADRALLSVIAKAHQFLTFTTPPNLQTAVATGLRQSGELLAPMRKSFQASRDYLSTGLKQLGFVVLPSKATYFLNIDITETGMTDLRFCDRLVREFGVAAIPVSAFFAKDPFHNVVRLCFAKKKETLDEALSRLTAASQKIGA
jgi:aspartate/methionine/tyrosine aminotransferase